MRLCLHPDFGQTPFLTTAQERRPAVAPYPRLVNASLAETILGRGRLSRQWDDHRLGSF